MNVLDPSSPTVSSGKYVVALRGQPQCRWWFRCSLRSAPASALVPAVSHARALLIHRAHCTSCASVFGPVSHRSRTLGRSRYRSRMLLPLVPHSVPGFRICPGISPKLSPGLVRGPGSPLPLKAGGGRLPNFRGYFAVSYTHLTLPTTPYV